MIIINMFIIKIINRKIKLIDGFVIGFVNGFVNNDKYDQYYGLSMK